MAQQIILRRGTSSEWSAVGSSLVLAAGEPGFETNTGKLKIGNGSSVWNALSYVSPSTLDELSDVSDVAADIGQVLTWSGTEWEPSDLPEDLDTTYSLSAETAGVGSAKIRLTDSNTIVDEIAISGAGSVSVARVDSNNITITGTPFDTSDSTFSGTTIVDTLSATTKVIAETVESVNPLKLVVTGGNLSVRASSGTIFGSADAGVDGPIVQVFNNSVFAATTISQSHNLADSAVYQWIRSRGTVSAPEIIQNGDALGSIRFAGYNGTVNAFGAAITVRIDGVPSSGIPIPTKMAFSTNNGTTGGAIRAELGPTGVWKINQLQALATDGNLQILNNGTGIVQLPVGTTVGGVPLGVISIQGSVASAASLPGSSTLGFLYITEDDGHGHIWNGTAWVDLGAIKGPAGTDGTNGADGFNGADGADGAPGADGADGQGVPVGGTTGQVLIKSSSDDYDTEWGTASTVADLNDLTDVVITGTPTNGQILKYDTVTSKWVNGTDLTSSIFTRQALSGSSSSLANGDTGPINITGFKSYTLLKVQTSAAAWVRIYVSEAARIADASRTEGEDPLPGAGIIAEVITTGAETVLITPGAIGFNNESPVTTNIPVRVTNKSGNTASITVTLTAIQLEA